MQIYSDGNFTVVGVFQGCICELWLLRQGECVHVYCNSCAFNAALTSRGAAAGVSRLTFRL